MYLLFKACINSYLKCLINKFDVFDIEKPILIHFLQGHAFNKLLRSFEYRLRGCLNLIELIKFVKY